MKRRTNTYNYLYKFLVSKCGITTSTALKKLEPKIDEPHHYVNAYLSDHLYPEGSHEDHVLYVTCDVNNPRFANAIYDIMNYGTPYFINHYLSPGNSFAVLRFRFPDKDSWDSFKRGHYSQMYKSEEKSELKRVFGSLEKQDYGFVRPATAILKSKKMLTNDLGYDPTEDMYPKDREEYFNNEFVTPIKLQEEILNYNHDEYIKRDKKNGNNQPEKRKATL
jgi:hypothetical protein